METNNGQTEIQAWMEDYIRSVIDVPTEAFPADTRFDNIGMDSVEVTIMAGMIEERFTLQVEPSEIFDNPNVQALALHLGKRLTAEA